MDWRTGFLSAVSPFSLVVVSMLVVLWFGFNPKARFRYRGIPGPFGWPFIGNLLPIVRWQKHEYYMHLQKKYGQVFKVWVGTTPVVVVCNVEDVRRVAYKLLDRFELPHTLLGADRVLVDDNRLIANYEDWKVLRKAWEMKVLSRESLKGYAPLIQDCCQHLVHFLEHHVAEGGGPVDIHIEMGKVAMMAVGACAFGIHFDVGWKGVALPASKGWEQMSARTLVAAYDFFRMLEVESASKWLLPVLMVPGAADFWRWMAYLLPDKGHLRSVAAARTLREIGFKVLKEARASRQQQDASATDGKQQKRSDIVPAAGEDEDDVASKQRDNSKPTAGQGLAEVIRVSFAAQLEAWRATEGKDVPAGDDMLMLQLFSFLVAGVETTSNTLAFTVHFLATNPEAEAKLLDELDSVLKGRTPTEDDLSQLEYVNACIQESLRLVPPGAVTFRTNNIPNLAIRRHHIPQGARLEMLNYSIHRDPSIWADPERYLPERFLPKSEGKLGPFKAHGHMPFGAGPRMCPGYKFALQELQLVVACLYQHFTFRKPPGEEPLKTRIGLALAPMHGLPVIAQPRPRVTGVA